MAMSTDNSRDPLNVDLSQMPGQGLSKEEAFLRILDGHWRYLDNQRKNVTTTEEDRNRHAQGQYPFAAILGCADSRVSPEVIFDQGQGDLFVVRVAGNVVGDFEVASLEYAIEHLGVSLVIVMGHEKCGAVKSAIATREAPGAIGKLLQQIYPAVDEAKNMEGDLLALAGRCHVSRCVDLLVEQSPSIASRVADGRLRVIGLIYDLGSGDLDIRNTRG